MNLLEWLKGLFGVSDLNLDANLSMEFMNLSNSGTKSKANNKIVVKKAGTVNVIQVYAQDTNKVSELLQPVKDAFQDGDVMFFLDDERKILSDVNNHEQNPHIAGLLRFFSTKIEQHDYHLLRTGLYIKYLREAGRNNESSKIYENVSSNSTNRDKNIINLASAGYFETYFRPLCNQVSREINPEKNFNELFEDAIEQMPFAIFVHNGMSAEEIWNVFMLKVTKNLRYGVKEEFIYIHGTGVVNVKKIKWVIQQMNGKFLKIKTTPSRAGASYIKVRVQYRENKLSQDELNISKYISIGSGH